MKIAIDFDGTIVEHRYPDIGAPVPQALETMKELRAAGHSLILCTMRSGEKLADAVRYCMDRGVVFQGINEAPGQKRWTKSPKPFGNIYIDDAALGCPLVVPNEEDRRPYVDWKWVKDLLIMKGVLEAPKT